MMLWSIKSNRFCLVLLFGIASSMLCTGCGFLGPLPNTIQEQVNDAVEHKLDGIIVYIDQAGKQAEFYSAGWNNREEKTLADPESLFKIASISKLYIAAATAKLVGSRRLSLDKTLAEYLPELTGKIQYADEITLRMMVQHRSGIPNYSDSPDFPWDDPPGNQEALKLVLNAPADFTPDKRYRYSNTNYLLIGEILDRTLGCSHHDYIKQQLLEPLGLNDTYSVLNEVNIDNVMSGYHIGYESDIKSNAFINPGGSMIATVRDVGIFLRALNDGSLFNEDEQAIYSSIYRYDHTGLLPGYSSVARYYKDIDAVVILFVNTSGGGSWAEVARTDRRLRRIIRRR